MKKLLTAIAMMSFGVAFAGDYHAGEELKCQQCHTMHSSRQHGFEVNTNTGAVSTSTFSSTLPGFDPVAKTITAQNKLLLAGSTNETCLSCHNGSYDVWGDTPTTSSRYNKRSGGNLNLAAGVTYLSAFSLGYVDYGTNLPFDDKMGHSMGSAAKAPGGTFQNTETTGFDCADCHEVHGNAAYRNLGPAAGGFDAASQPTYTLGNAADAAYDVVETTHSMYDGSNVFFGSGGGANRMNAYCAKCHGNFHTAANVEGTGGAFKRHPTGDSANAYDFATTDTVGGILRWRAADAVRPVVTATGVSPGCLSCHKAHGNARAFALILADEDGGVQTDKENGDQPFQIDYAGRYLFNPKGLCQTCHVQGK